MAAFLTIGMSEMDIRNAFSAKQALQVLVPRTTGAYAQAKAPSFKMFALCSKAATAQICHQAIAT